MLTYLQDGTSLQDAGKQHNTLVKSEGKRCFDLFRNLYEAVICFDGKVALKMSSRSAFHVDQSVRRRRRGAYRRHQTGARRLFLAPKDWRFSESAGPISLTRSRILSLSATHYRANCDSQ